MREVHVSGENGEKPTDSTKLDTVVLTYNRETDHLDIGGIANSLDLMLDMLGRATRALEQRLKEEAAVKLRAKLLEQEQNARIAAALARGN